MELKEYLQTVRKWWWLITLCTLCAGVSSFIVSNVMPPIYEARVLLMSNQSTNTGIIDYSSLLGGQQVIETYQELLQTRSLLETVIASLDLPYSPKELAKHIKVSIIPETQLLDLRVQDNNAQSAADIANEIALTFLLQRSAEQQLQEIEEYEQTVVMQMMALEQAIEETKTKIEQLHTSPGLLTQEELVAMEANQSQQRTAYANLLAGYLSIRTMKSRLLDVVIAEPAQPPAETIGPRKELNTALATMSGCIIACIIAFLLEYLNDNLENVDDVREALSLPNLGTIPFAKSWQTNGNARVQENEWPLAEAFRVLRTNIQFANVDNIVRTLLITSSEPSEGKTSIVANLGAAIAQSGRKVLLVDADLRRSQLHRTLEAPNLTGLTSLMLNDADQEKCITKTDIPNLLLLSSGPLPPNPSELLGSQRMGELIEGFQSLADVVLFDTSPVLACADAMVLATQVDGVILVIDSRSTRRETARHAVESLCQVGANLVGTVLNAVPTHRDSYYRYHYEYHQDGGKRQKLHLRRWKEPLTAMQRLFGRKQRID